MTEKTITRTQQIEEKVYVAADGTEFCCEHECEKYEKSATCMLLVKYNNLVFKASDEFDLFNMGSCEERVDIVNIKSQEDVDLCLQLTLLHRSTLMGNSDYGKKCLKQVTDILKEGLEEKTPVFIARGDIAVENDFYPVNTWARILLNIQHKEKITFE